MEDDLRLFIGSTEFLPEDARERMLANGRAWRESGDENAESRMANFPVVKLFSPDTECIWLLTELDPDEPDMAWGLLDLGMGWPELSWSRLSELKSVCGPLGLPIVRDPHFEPEKTIGKYAHEAQISGRALGRILPQAPKPLWI